jgi:hypothetical protein
MPFNIDIETGLIHSISDTDGKPSTWTSMLLHVKDRYPDWVRVLYNTVSSHIVTQSLCEAIDIVDYIKKNKNKLELQNGPPNPIVF